ncbi:protein FAM193B isoform X2 [Scleropages formosus]|uniref:protein FAM193B isoform X2 n=1 Tax=Scleropages formosus TaxID=113540 RepID=UPI0010FA7C4E|nr:protein FAM193B isoform X2 [Scleropages formosus]
MARKKSRQQGAANKEPAAGQHSAPKKKPVSPGDAAGGGDAGAERLAGTSTPLALPGTEPMHTCCLLCHREFKDWGVSRTNGLPDHGTKADSMPALSQALLREAPGRKLADAMPSLSQSLLGEVPLWICQTCRKSVEEEERRGTQEQALGVPLSHSSSCKTQSCGNGYSETSSGEWDPSSFLSAHKLSGLWNSAHSNGPEHCNHGAAAHSPAGPTCHEKRTSHEASGKSTKPSGAKVCPYSHPVSQNTSMSSAGSSLSTSTDRCKTTPKHFKTMCRRPTPPGEAFHSTDHHQHSDLAVPPNSPTGLSSQHSSLLPPKQGTGQQMHVSSPTSGLAAHSPFTPLVPNLHVPVSKLTVGPENAGSAHKASACKNSHIPSVGTQHAKLGPSLTTCSHPCNGHSNGAASITSTGHLPGVACRDQACKGHKLANGTACHPACELEEGEDEDSSSERSSCASSSTNQKDGKYCDCCYCEFFGHNAPPAAPTSRNFAEIRERLRSQLTRRKEELPQRQDSDPAVPTAIDHRDVDELLDFINSTEPKPVNSAKAAKRARHKQKKKEKEKALQGSVETSCSGAHTGPLEPVEDIPVAAEGDAGRLLEWPQLELERVNSFLTSRLEEIKNTIKDSIRASFSMYDLNLDVNDFPKKAATLEGNHLLSHVNGSSDLQQIDLDLSPLTLGNFKSHLLNGWEDSAPGSQDVQRLHATPSLSKLIRVRSPERGQAVSPAAASESTAPGFKVRDEQPDPRCVAGGSSKVKKGKKQQLQQQQPLPQQDPWQSEQQSAKPAKAAPGTEFLKNKETQTKAPVLGTNSKASFKVSSQSTRTTEPQKVPGKRLEETKVGRHPPGSLSCVGAIRQLEKSDTEGKGPKLDKVDQEAETKNTSFTGAGLQQSKGKGKKNKNKVDKTSSSIDLDPTEMDEIDREVEYFKRFCLDSAKQTRQKVAVNWSNFSLKKVQSSTAQ